MTDRPDPSHALAALQSGVVDPILVVCTDRHHRLARFYPTPAGVLAEVLVRGRTAAVAWLPDEAGLPVEPACRCHRPTFLDAYTEPFNFAAAVLLHPPVNVAKYRVAVYEEARRPILTWVDRAGVSRPVRMPSEFGMPPLMEHLRGGGRVSLAPQ